MENKQYTSLNKLDGQNFTVKSVQGFNYQMWSNPDNRFIKSDTPKEGFSKKWSVDTDKGLLDLGTGQMGNLLEAVFKDGKVDLIGKTFSVKSNGKEKLDKRYFINEVKDFQPEETQNTMAMDERGDDSGKDEMKLDDDLEGLF